MMIQFYADELVGRIRKVKSVEGAKAYNLESSFEVGIILEIAIQIETDICNLYE